MARGGGLLVSRRENVNLENDRPEFAGDKEPIVLGIKGYAVENVNGSRRAMHARSQSRQVNPAHDLTGLR